MKNNAAIREQIAETLKRFKARAKTGGMSTQEFHLFFSYLDCLLRALDNREINTLMSKGMHYNDKLGGNYGIPAR